MLPTGVQVLGRVHSVMPMLVTCVTDCWPGARKSTQRKINVVICVTDWSTGAKQSTKGKFNVGYPCYRLLARC